MFTGKGHNSFSEYLSISNPSPGNSLVLLSETILAFRKMSISSLFKNQTSLVFKKATLYNNFTNFAIIFTDKKVYPKPVVMAI